MSLLRSSLRVAVMVAWRWDSSDPAPNCFNTTTVTYFPEGGGDSFLQFSNPGATEATLTDLQCTTNYTITVVATTGQHRKEGVATTVYLPLQGVPCSVHVHLYTLCTLEVVIF